MGKEETDKMFMIKIPRKMLKDEQVAFLRKHVGEYIMDFVPIKYGGSEETDKDPTDVVKKFLSPVVMGDFFDGMEDEELLRFQQKVDVWDDPIGCATKKHERAEFLSFYVL